MRSTSPPRRRHQRAAPSGFMAFYTENFKKLSDEYLKEHNHTGSVTHISKIAAKKYAELTAKEKTKYKNDIYFFKADEEVQNQSDKSKDATKKQLKEQPKEKPKEQPKEQSKKEPSKEESLKEESPEEPKKEEPPKEEPPKEEPPKKEPPKEEPPKEEPLKEEIKSVKFDDNTDDLNGFCFV